MKRANTYKGFLDPQSEFSHHMGWAKAKKSNKRTAKLQKTISDAPKMATVTRVSERRNTMQIPISPKTGLFLSCIRPASGGDPCG